jgi:hypothetical protein
MLGVVTWSSIQQGMWYVVLNVHFRPMTLSLEYVIKMMFTV